MGWQDAPVVKSGVPSVKPAWMSAPVATPKAEPRVGPLEENLAGPGEVLASGIANIPGGAINAVNDLATKLTGGAYNPGKVPTVPTGAGGRQLMGDIANLPGIKQVVSGDQAADAALKTAAPNVHEALHTAGDEAGDILNILPAAGAVSKGVGVARTAAEAAEAARAPLAAGDIEGALKASGYPSLPSKTVDASGAAKVGASAVGEGTLTGPQSLTSQAVTDRFAQHEAGVAPDQELNYANIEAARKAGPAKVYDAAHAALPPSLTQDPQLSGALAKIGDTTSQLPSAPDVDALKAHMLSQPDMTSDQLFANVQSAREKAAKLFNATTPDAPALADAYTGIANAYEDFIGRQLGANPRSPVSLEDFQNARTAFAKNYAVQTALKGTSIDAKKFATLQRKEPSLLTGPSQLIAEQANRYPLSTGFGPETLADTGIGPSGSIAGGAARHITGPIIGGGLGAVASHLMGMGPSVGAAGGAAVGQLASTGLMNLVRKALSGTPEAGRAAAGAALEDPRLADFFNPPEAPQKPPGPLALQPPPGQAFAPHQPDLATGATPQRDFFGYGTGGMTADTPMTGPPPLVPGHPGEISLADVLSHGTEQLPAEGLSLAPMGHDPGQGLPFSVDAGHAAGDLTLADLLTHATPEDLRDLAHVASQGVPEDILQRGSKAFKPSARDRPGQTAVRRPSTLAELLDPGGG